MNKTIAYLKTDVKPKIYTKEELDKLSKMLEQMSQYRKYIMTVSNPFGSTCPVNALEPNNDAEVWCGDIDSKKKRILKTFDDIMKCLKNTEYDNNAMKGIKEKCSPTEKDFNLFMSELNSIITSLDEKIKYQKGMINNGKEVEQGEGEKL